MKTVDSKVTISRVTVNRGEDHIEISVVDRLSGNVISTTKMSVADFGYAITGQGAMNGKTDIYRNYDHYGLKKVVKTMVFESEEISKYDLKSMDKNKAYGIIYKDFLFKKPDDNCYWSIIDFGLDRQQNGKHHEYTIVKYVDPEAIEDDK